VNCLSLAALLMVVAAFRRSDFADHRPSAFASFKAALDVVETEFLDDRAWIGGDKIALADIHVAWVIRWGLTSLGIGSQEGFDKENFPKVFKWYAPASD
jgi:glutathione S-transferase